MNTSARIKTAALDLFAAQGYEGTSMAQIAEEVGIKTPSIYAHFKGKEELFLSVLQDASKEELAFATAHLDADPDQPLHGKLYNLLLYFRDKYEHDNGAKFWIRMMYFPPTALYKESMELAYVYLGKLEELLTAVFENNRISIAVDAGTAAAAYLCLMDGMIVELLYGTPASFERRLDASWEVFKRGISPSS
ncbi:TetR/AcrR family transcriptional regulator [Paenibacillus lutrae]|uniref:TetR family transcriptional regulator n=1 Tax=Paenibacillus lutrae TaxID=2078573 RepID=A0A7X3FFY3_9BACL|nr:TetR/AcrR family transcriptional regulator [Paenibacillus lutrae]MVO98934.1 TetR family transcriptional regulator [Paenibacillus lutrae]